MKNLNEINSKMKTLNKTILAFALIFTISCDTEEILIEESISNQTASGYFSSTTGFEDLSKSIYPLLRPISQMRALTLNGTDIFSGATAWDQVGNQLNTSIETYGPELTEGIAEVQDLWVYNYKNINRANTVISRAPILMMILMLRPSTSEWPKPNSSDPWRCLIWFSILVTYPCLLMKHLSANKEVTRVPSAEVYTQIISDLTAAEAVLPATASDYGRATKGAAQHLLARVYLTRGWNFQNALGGSNADFNLAREYADKVIAAHPMVSDYLDLFPRKSEDPTNQTHGPGDQNARNSEVVFAVQYSDAALTNVLETADQSGASFTGDGGNNSHSIFGGSHDESPGSPGRTEDYNRQLGQHNTLPGVWRLFDPNTDS